MTIIIITPVRGLEIKRILWIYKIILLTKCSKTVISSYRASPMWRLGDRPSPFTLMPVQINLIRFILVFVTKLF